METNAWLDLVKSRGIDAVEVENSHLTSEIAKFNANNVTDKATFYTSVIVSDLPGSEHALGKNNGLTSHTFVKMVDLYVAALGIEGLELRAAGEDRSKPLAKTARERAILEVADKLVPRELPRSSFLRDRIAKLIGGIADAFLSLIDTSKKLKPADVNGLSDEDKRALEAEVAGAYTDKALNASLERGNAVVSRLAAELLEKYPSAKFELVAGGGIESGAFSPVTGITLDVRGSDAVKAAAAEILSKISVEGAPPVKLGPVSKGIALGKGEMFKVEPQPLVRLHSAAALEHKGVLLREASVDYVGKVHRGAGVVKFEEVAGLNLGELMVRARRTLGREDVPTNRTALLGLLTGLDQKGVERANAEWRAKTPVPAKTRGVTSELDRIKSRERTKDRVR
jgi:hypothetical protein